MPLKRLAPFAESAICFGTNKEYLKKAAKSAAIHLTVNHNSQFALWNALPQEIRLEILRHTDLSRGSCDVNNPRRSQRAGIEIRDGKKALPRAHKCCQTCSSVRSCCCCFWYHAAYSTTCTCPRSTYFPSALFRVSKFMQSEATMTFFSGNRFIFVGDFEKTQCFLTNSVSTTALRYLRTVDLELVFSQFKRFRDHPNDRHSRKWESLISTIADLLSPHNICLSIKAGDFLEDMDPTTYNKNQGYTWLSVSTKQLFDPFNRYSAAQGLRKFRVALCWWPGQETVFEREMRGENYRREAEEKPTWKECFPDFAPWPGLLQNHNLLATAIRGALPGFH